MQRFLTIFSRAFSCWLAFLCCLVVLTIAGYASQAPGPDGYGYTVASATYSWIDISSTGTSVGFTSLDEFVGPLPIGFPFVLYGNDYSEFYIQGYGVINFVNRLITYENQCPLPDNGVAENSIAIMWTVIDPASGGAVYYQSFSGNTNELCPYQGYSGACLVVEYQNVPLYSPQDPNPPKSTFEAILFDNNNIILQFHDSELTTDWGAGSTTGIEGNNYAADYGLSYVCNTPGSLTSGLAVQFAAPSMLELSLKNRQNTSCSGNNNSFDLHLVNYKINDTVGFDLSYAVTNGSGSFTGPQTVTVVANSIAPFTVNMVPSGQVGDVVTGTITATGGGETLVSAVAVTITQGSFKPVPDEPDNGRSIPVLAGYAGKIWSLAGDNGTTTPSPVRIYDPGNGTWIDVIGSEAPFGNTTTRSGCRDDETVYLFVNEGTDKEGLFAYNMTANTWESLGGLINQPNPVTHYLAYGAWAYDDVARRCYLTGGWVSGAESNTVFVFDPVNREWLSPLSPFSHGRYGHAAWVVGSGNDKKLCVAGGYVDLVDTGSVETEKSRLQTTQCYSFSSTSWSPENTDLGPLPEPLAGAGYTSRKSCTFSEELWLVGGINSQNWYDDLNAATWYYDVATGSWLRGPSLVQKSMACAAVNLGNELYKISGYDAHRQSIGVSEHLVMCKGCFPWLLFLPAITGMGSN